MLKLKEILPIRLGNYMIDVIVKLHKVICVLRLD